jgi:hypothetical protein
LEAVLEGKGGRRAREGREREGKGEGSKTQGG